MVEPIDIVLSSKKYSKALLWFYYIKFQKTFNEVFVEAKYSFALIFKGIIAYSARIYQATFSASQMPAFNTGTTLGIPRTIGADSQAHCTRKNGEQ